ncbi:MAG: hypothetical protein AAFY01_02955 [Pseudomonadota bacterium]
MANRQSDGQIKSAWFLTVVAGLAVLLIAIFLMPKFPTDSAGIEPGYGSPVIAFEMARSVADLHAVFGTPDDPERARRIAMMDDGNIWDFPFMIAYGLFIALFLRAAGKASGNSIWYLLAMLGIIAAAADAIENNILLGLTADIEGAPDIGLLAYPVWTKFLSIMITGAAAGVAIATQGRHFWRILGVVATASALLVLPGFYDPATYGTLLTLGITICWVIMLIFAITRWRQA